jgi:hypothetical protein
MYRVLIQVFIILIKIFKTVLKSKNDIILENLALRQQLSLYKAKKQKVRLNEIDRTLWIALKETWAKWLDVLVFVKPEAVLARLSHKKNKRNDFSGLISKAPQLAPIVFFML